MATRAAIRQALASKIPGAYVGTAAAGSTVTELLDNDDEFLTFSGDGAPNLQGAWILRPNEAGGDRLRRAAHHNSDAGILKPSRGWTGGPSVGETFEIWPSDMRPGIVDSAINDGLERLTYLSEESISPVVNDNDYSLAAYTWIQSERDVREVYYEWTQGNIKLRSEWPWWKVWNDSGVLTLRVDPIPQSTSGIAIIVEGVAHYTTLSADASTTAAPTAWVVAAAQLELFRRLRKNSYGQDNKAWLTEYALAKGELQRLSRRYAPRRGRRLMPRSPMRMPSLGTTHRGELLY